jgi:hypothetical protein
MKKTHIRNGNAATCTYTEGIQVESNEDPTDQGEDGADQT